MSKIDSAQNNLSWKTRSWIGRLLSYLLPHSCHMCRALIQSNLEHSHNAICTQCWKKISWLTSSRCRTCCTKLELDLLDDPQCLDCSQSKWHFEKIIACTQYDQNSSKIAIDLKYKGLLAPYIASSIIRADFHTIKKMHYVVPVPLHPMRLLKRGYNQAELVAKQISKQSRVPLCLDLLVRITNTSSQGGLSKRTRKSNVEGAFALSSKSKTWFQNNCPTRINQLYGRNVLLVDDVVTTSATVEACAKALSALGCKVFIACWAKRILEEGSNQIGTYE